MVSFVIYDLIFLALFTLGVALFLYIKRKNLQRQGIMYLYRTRIGIKIIDWTAKKFSKILKPVQYLVIVSGYTLMALMIWFLVKFSWFYLTSPTAARALRVPVLLPLVPYIDKIIPFLPPFYFTYWIIIIALIAIPHEFAHGIFARLNKIKVHSTGFGFLGPFLAAFVEPDEKDMSQLKKFTQLVILAAGTFANILVTIFFGILLWLFFISSFTAAGVNFNTYSSSLVNVSDLSIIGDPSEDINFVEIQVNGVSYFAAPEILQHAQDNNIEQIIVFDDAPAFNVRLSGSISEINGEKITSFDELGNILQQYNPGDEIEIKTIQDNEVKEFDITLAEREGKAFLGVGIFPPRSSSGLLGKFYGWITSIKDPTVYYESSIGDMGIFIYDLLWWSILISLSVALVNMIPVGIFDGGRFFFLTVWGLTGSEKAGKKAFVISTWLILLLVAALMLKWVFAFI